MHSNFYFFIFFIAIISFSYGILAAKLDRHPPSEYNENSCPLRCNEAYYPLCGKTESGETKVFVNDCYMSMENCNQLPQRGNAHALHIQ